MERQRFNQFGKNNNILVIYSFKDDLCLFQFYDFVEGSLKMNDVIETVGFLSYDLATVTSAMDGSVEQLPPPSQVPRLHAVASRPVHSCNPLITPQVTIGRSSLIQSYILTLSLNHQTYLKISAHHLCGAGNKLVCLTCPIKSIKK